jgi:hypothetical protein
MFVATSGRLSAGIQEYSPPSGNMLRARSCIRHPITICLRLLQHCICRAASRAVCTAGNNNAIKIPMIVMTTNSSTSVKPRLRNELFISVPEKTKRVVKSAKKEVHQDALRFSNWVTQQEKTAIIRQTKHPNDYYYANCGNNVNNYSRGGAISP